MTFRSHLMSLFPLAHLSLIITFFILLIRDLSVPHALAFIFFIYFFPIICFHLHNKIFPLQTGTANLAEKNYSGWWGTHQIQGLYNAFPAFETILKLIPGLYSAWLRLWGSQIGANIYWTAQVEITDRSLMVIGDSVIFGHKVGCYAHAVSSQYNKLLLYIKPIKIGNNVFIGAGSRIGPGAQIADGKTLPILTIVSVNQIVGDEVACQAKN